MMMQLGYACAMAGKKAEAEKNACHVSQARGQPFQQSGFATRVLNATGRYATWLRWRRAGLRPAFSHLHH